MNISNTQIAKYFELLSEYVELSQENPFRVRAYQNAARTIATYPKSIEEMVLRGEDLTKLPHIGEKIAKKIEEIVYTGKMTALEHYKAMFPKGLLDILAIPGIGAKRARILYEQLGIDSLEKLKKAAKEHKISKLPGFSQKLEKRILKGIMMLKQEGQRFLYSEVESYALELESYMIQCKVIKKAVIAGSYRRRKETVGDLDMVIVTKDPKTAADYFVSYPKCKEVIVKGESRTTILLDNDLQVDLKSARASDFGATLNYFTGSKAHTLALRKMAKERGWKLNEYGLFDDNGVVISGKSEKSFYKAFGLAYIEPELREMRGELEAAADGTLPKLIKEKHIKGDLHMHTAYSDGNDTVAQMADTARAKGYKYISISDHSYHIPLLHGLTEEKIYMQWAEIDAYNKKYPDFKILKGIEVDILENGTLAMEDKILSQLDIVVASVHDHFNLSKKKQTERIIRAMQNPYVHILGHPTGRLIGKRPPYALNMEKIFEASLKYNIIMEINAQPRRLDLNDIYTKNAKEMGIRFAINSDAHYTFCLEYMHYGINQARRGWLEKGDVINTYSLKKLQKTLKK